MSRLQWLTERRKGIGGSDAASILGVSKFGNEWSVYLDKSGVKPINDSDEEPLHLLLGRLLEPVVAELYSRATKNILANPPGLLVHPQHDCIVGTPDRLVVGQERGVEIKTVNSYSRTEWGEPGTDQVPDEYLIQSQHYMGLTGYGIWDVPVLFSAARFEIYTVPNDRDFIAWMTDRLVQWWELRIVKGVKPTIDDSDSCSDYIKARYPRSGGTMLALEETDNTNELAQRLAHVRSQMDVLETEKVTLENRIKELIGDADGLEGLFGKATWKKAKDTEATDWRAVTLAIMQHAPAEVLEAAIKEHSFTKPGSRRFLFRPNAVPTTTEDNSNGK